METIKDFKNNIKYFLPELEHAAELVQDFHKSYPDEPGPLISLC